MNNTYEWTTTPVGEQHVWQKIDQIGGILTKLSGETSHETEETPEVVDKVEEVVDKIEEVVKKVAQVKDLLRI